MHFSIGETVFHTVGDSNSDRLARNIHQNILDGTSPARADDITSKAPWHLQREIHSLVLRSKRGSINIVCPYIGGVHQMSSLQPRLTYLVNRCGFQSLKHGTPYSCCVHLVISRG